MSRRIRKRKWTGRTDGLGGKITGKTEAGRDVGNEGYRSNIKTVKKDRILGTTFNDRLIVHGGPNHDPGRTIRRARAHSPASFPASLPPPINQHDLERYDELLSDQPVLGRPLPPIRNHTPEISSFAIYRRRKRAKARFSFSLTSENDRTSTFRSSGSMDVIFGKL